MDQIEAIQRYLRHAARPYPARSGRERGSLPFITISRESGAGGTLLAQQLLASFEARKDDPVFEDWGVFDSELCELVASDPELNVGLRELLDESSLNAAEDMVAMMLGRSPQREVHRKVTETIRELALVGKAIIVGRGAAGITRDLATGIHFRLVAPLSVRVERLMPEVEGDLDAVTRAVRERDRNRATLVRRICDRDIHDSLLYDAVWNTERTPVDVIVQSVLDWVVRLPVRAATEA